MARFTTRGPKGDTGAAGSGSPTDTFSKIILTNNGTTDNIKVGDDIYLGDGNVANSIVLKGQQNETNAGIVLGSGKTEKISTDGSNLSVEADNDIVLYPGSTYAYIDTPELDGGNRIATWDYVQSGRHGSSASYWSTEDQTGTVNSIQPMTITDNDWETGISVANNSRITMANTGKYNIAFSAQLRQTNSSGVVNIWLAKNGTAVANSNTKVSMSANDPWNVAAWNFFVDAAANDYYQIMWSSDSASSKIEAEAATGSGATLHPAIPSVIITVNQVG